jgi:hypothetical protein
MGETHSPSVGRVGYDISPLLRVKLKGLKRRNNGRNDYKQQNNEDMRTIS